MTSKHQIKKKITLKKIRNMLIELKSVPCVDCGISYHWYVMDFDHRRGIKEFEISVLSKKAMSHKRIMAEVAKCDVVCANCHRVRTYRDTLNKLTVDVKENLQAELFEEKFSL